MDPQCKRCLAELPAEALVCNRCHTLVHADQLQQLAASARMLEDSKDWAGAIEHWQKALELLPADVNQRTWIQEHLGKLETARPATTVSAPRRSRWPAWLAPIAPVLLLLSKGKALLAFLKFNFLFSLFAFLGVYWSLFGMAFGIGFAVQILIHEMGHFIDIKRRGLPADMPVFLPGFGAYVRWAGMGVPLKSRAEISLAGPLAGWMAAAACAAIWLATGNDLYAALARTGAWLNLLNLIPVWALDGGQAMSALTRNERRILCALSFVLYLMVGEGVILLVALGVAFRLFTKDFPEEPSLSTSTYFAAVLCALAGVVWLVPGHGFGR